MSDESRPDQPCPRCHIGRLHGRRANYLHTLEEQIMVIPHAAIESCDMCGYTIHDHALLRNVAFLIRMSRPAHRRSGATSWPAP